MLALFEKNEPQRPFVAARWRRTISEMREVIERARLAGSRGGVTLSKIKMMVYRSCDNPAV